MKKSHFDQLRENHVEVSAVSAEISALEVEEARCFAAIAAENEETSAVEDATRAWREEQGKAWRGLGADVEGALVAKQSAEQRAEERNSDAEGARAALPQVQSDKATLEIKRAKLLAKAYPPASLHLADQLGSAWARHDAAEAALQKASAELRGICDAATEVCPNATVSVWQEVGFKLHQMSVDESHCGATMRKVLSELADVGVTPGNHLKSGASSFDELAGGARDAFCAAVGKPEWRVKYPSSSASRPVQAEGVTVTYIDSPVTVAVKGEDAHPQWDGPSRVVIDHGAEAWQPGRVPVR